MQGGHQRIGEVGSQNFSALFWGILKFQVPHIEGITESLIRLLLFWGYLPFLDFMTVRGRRSASQVGVMIRPLLPT